MIPTPPLLPENLTLDAHLHDPVWEEAILVIDEMSQCAIKMHEIAQEQNNKDVSRLCLSLSRALVTAKQSWRLVVAQPDERGPDFVDDEAEQEEIESAQHTVIEILQVGHETLAEISDQLQKIMK